VSALTEFLHKLVDKAGVSELHDEIDALDKPTVATSPAPVDAPDSGEEGSVNATE
jgi:hypothetical protein